MDDRLSVFWFRRDLRIDDNAGLYYALRSGNPVLPVFIFDKNILDDLRDKKDKRVQFIYDVLKGLHEELRVLGSGLSVMHGTPEKCFRKLLQERNLVAVYANNDYEPYATARDKKVAALLKENNIGFLSYKDQVIFEKAEVIKDNKDPYTVFTPYSRRWLEKLNDFYLTSYPNYKYKNNFVKYQAGKFPTIEDIGFERSQYKVVPPALDEDIARDYEKKRDIPAIKGTTRLSIHLRFGTISIRQLARDAKELNNTLLKELIWREFYQTILWHFPRVVSESFKKEYDNIKWRNNEKEFERWCQGQTGYPIIDAGMRELKETGFMHNRVRMITASFLTKHLLIDWRWGEAYFGEKLLDYDLAANNGGWQWAAGSGCDAVPYFRIFNPQLQTEKFDPELKYVLHWVPELNTLDYPQPIVDHREARERCLDVYKAVLQK